MPDRNTSGYVLIVDDDEDIGETISLVLGTRGYKSSVARDGAEALQLMHDEPLPQVVLLDMMMPGMNGEDFRAAQLKDPRIADVPVVIMTGDGRAEEKAARLGVSRFLRKPIAINDLIDVIAAVRKPDAP
jgi:CheY-like chemotaxis protein